MPKLSLVIRLCLHHTLNPEAVGKSTCSSTVQQWKRKRETLLVLVSKQPPRVCERDVKGEAPEVELQAPEQKVVAITPNKNQPKIIVVAMETPKRF